MLKLWLTTCPHDFAGEYDDIEEMFKRGLSRLILRKQSSLPEYYERWLLSLPFEYRDRVWVWGTPDTAEQLDVRGCVAEASTFTGAVPESWKRINCIALCRSLEQVEALPDWVAGALVGPLFQPFSALEPMDVLAGSSQIFETFCSSIEKLGKRIPLILYGGIDEDNLGQIRTLGVSGVSILGGIWNYADPINAFIKTSRAL